MARVRALVVYGSSRGGTAGLAATLGDALTRQGHDVTVQPATLVDDLSGYDAVVVGGALYNNRWHPDAVAFVHRYRPALLARQVWFFSSGPLDDSARSGAIAPVPQVRELARITEVRGHMTFGGVLADRPGGRLAGLFSYGPAGDWRDPDHVEQWAGYIAGQLGQERAAPARATPEPYPGSPQERAAAAVVVLPDGTDPARLPSGRTAVRTLEEPGGLSRIRRMLALDEIDDDVGLDVLL